MVPLEDVDGHGQLLDACRQALRNAIEPLGQILNLGVGGRLGIDEVLLGLGESPINEPKDLVETMTMIAPLLDLLLHLVRKLGDHDLLCSKFRLMTSD